MPSFSFNNIAFTGKMVFAPLIKGASFVVSQYVRMTKGATDLYGTSLAASAIELAVGAPGPSSPTSGTGKVYLYTKSGDDWVDAATITGPSTNKIGQAVDFNSEWLAISGTTGTAAVYLYRKVAGVWGATPFQTITTADAGINFGYSLALSGSTLAIGHREANSSNGAVQIWVFDGTTWNKQATILPPAGIITANNAQRVGFSVALSGDLLVAGGAGATGANGNGLVMVSTRNGTTWSTPVAAIPTGGANGSGLGASVVIANGQIIAGAPNINTVYVFSNNNGTWSQTAKLDVSINAGSVITDSTATGSRVGWSVSANATASVIVAGAYSASAGGTAAGAAYVFELVDGVWGPSATMSSGVSKILSSPATANQRFGWSTAMSGSQVLVGGTGNGSSVTGAFYTFK